MHVFNFKMNVNSCYILWEIMPPATPDSKPSMGRCDIHKGRWMTERGNEIHLKIVYI